MATLVDDVFFTSVILKTADVAESTEAVVCFTPSMNRLTEPVLPAVKPVPAKVYVRLLEPASYPAVSEVTVATGATKLNLQDSTHTTFDSVDAAKTTMTSTLLMGVAGSKLVLRTRQVSSVVVAVRMSQ